MPPADDQAFQRLELDAPLICANPRRAGRGSVLRNVCSFILAAEFCERLAYYGLAASLTIFFRREFQFSSLLSTEINALFASVSYVTPLVGAYLADTRWGRFRTITYFSALYMAGLALCTVSAHPSLRWPAPFMLGLFGGVAVGAGGIKPNVITLGADQFGDGPAQAKEKEAFFNYFYWAVNSGSVLSYGLLAYAAVNGVPALGVSERDGFFFSFAVPTAAFALGLAVFVGGRARYVVPPPGGSAVARFARVVSAAARASADGRLLLRTLRALLPAVLLAFLSFFVTGEPLHTVLAALSMALIVGCVVVAVVRGPRTDWVAGHPDARAVLRLTPYLGYMVAFWAVDAQIFANFVLQGCQMDLEVASGMELSAAQLGVVDGVTVLLAIPLFTQLVYPALRRAGFEVTLRQRIGAGFACCAASMAVAGVVEIARRGSPLAERVSNCDEDVPTRELSVLWQLPQYALIGFSEVLTSVGAYEFFYAATPESMRSICQALNLATTTLGFMVSGAVNSLLGFWLPSDLDHGRLDLIFFGLAGVMALNLASYVSFCREHGFRRSVSGSSGSGSGDALLSDD